MRAKKQMAAGALIAIAAAGCGGGQPASPRSAPPPSGGPSSSAPAPAATESNPPGDIPDTTAFVAYRPASGLYQIKVPEGWARTDLTTGASFTDKLNTVRIEAVPASTAPTEATVRGTEVPKIGAAKLELVKVDTVQRRGGTAVRAVYRFDSTPDPVTGKVVRDEAERYAFFKAGHEAVLTLAGPVGADNVDPWRTVSDSFRWL